MRDHDVLAIAGLPDLEFARHSASLVSKLREGYTLAEASAALGIATDTARTQLKSVFGKLRVRRQTELQRLLGRMDLIDPS